MANVAKETAYVMRFIEFTNRPDSPPYSLRQFAVYHKYVAKGPDRCSTWLLFGMSQRTEMCFDNLMRREDDPHALNPMITHVLLFDVVIASWRPYLLHLDDSIRNLVSPVHDAPFIS